MPLETLPLEVLSTQFSEFVSDENVITTEKWVYSETPVSYESFDLFYVENSHNYGSNYDLKDLAIKTFYRRAARIRGNNPERSSMIFFSNTRQPFVGSGEQFTEDIAGMMREGVSSRPNRLNDKKLLRSNVYAKNITSVGTLRVHFFVGDQFYSEAQQTNRWLLKEFVQELHIELNAEETEVIMYKLGGMEEPDLYINKINSSMIQGINYRIATIEL